MSKRANQSAVDLQLSERRSLLSTAAVDDTRPEAVGDVASGESDRRSDPQQEYGWQEDQADNKDPNCESKDNHTDEK